MKRTLLTLAAFVGGAPLSPALAQPAAEAPAEPGPAQLEQARTLFITGSQAYRENKYGVAIEAFQAAYELAPRGSIIFALAQANRLQYFVDGEFARIERAVELYRTYIERDDVDPEQSAVAMRHLQTLMKSFSELNRKQDTSIGRIIVSANVDGARVRMGDGEPVQVPEVLEAKPGPVQVTFEAPGYAPQTREIVAVGGSAVPIDVQLVPLPGALRIDTEEGAQVLVDGRTLGAAPVAPLELPPGEHRVVVLSSGRRPFVESVTITPEREVIVDAPLEQTGQRVAAWFAFGAAGVLATTAGIMGYLTLEEQQKAEALHDLWQEEGLDPDDVTDYRAHLSRRDDWALRTLGVGVGAGIAAACGGILWLLDDPKAPNQPVLTPSVAPDGSGVTLLGRFEF